MSKNLYKIGDKTIDLDMLVAVGTLYKPVPYVINLPLALSLNTNIEAEFNFEQFGIDKEMGYENQKKLLWELTEKEVEKLLAVWTS